VVEFNGLIGLLILIADVWAIINILQSPATTGSKVLWTVVVLLLPVLGLLIWFFAGPRGHGPLRARREAKGTPRNVRTSGETDVVFLQHLFGAIT
jgi:hypothetical protein